MSKTVKEARGMQGTGQFQTGQPTVKQDIRAVTHEARALISRRKFFYAALALVLLAAAIYASTIHANPNANADLPNRITQTKTDSKSSVMPQEPGTTDAHVSNNNSGDVSNMNSTSVIVNGQNITVPNNGTTQTTMTGDGSSTSVNVSHEVSGGSNYNYSSLNVNVQTNSSSEEGGE